MVFIFRSLITIIDVNQKSTNSSNGKIRKSQHNIVPIHEANLTHREKKIYVNQYV